MEKDRIITNGETQEVKLFMEDKEIDSITIEGEYIDPLSVDWTEAISEAITELLNRNNITDKIPEYDANGVFIDNWN
jgi:hypothetical protein